MRCRPGVADGGWDKPREDADLDAVWLGERMGRESADVVRMHVRAVVKGWSMPTEIGAVTVDVIVGQRECHPSRWEGLLPGEAERFGGRFCNVCERGPVICRRDRR